MVTKHTTGPWAVDGFSLSSVITGKKPYHTIARCLGGNGNEYTIEKAHANANLIACAPELLEMLQRIKPFLMPAQMAEVAALITKATRL